MNEKTSVLRCRELAAFDSGELAAVQSAFRDAAECPLRQHWLGGAEPDFRPAIVRAGWRAEALLVFAELADDDPFNAATALNQKTWELGDVLEVFLQPAGQDADVEFHITPENQRLQLRFPDTATLRRAQESGDFSACLLWGDAMRSRIWVQREQRRWCAFAEIPSAVVCGRSAPLAGQKWRFSFSRCDATRGRPQPVVSSTSPHTERDLHRRVEWRTLVFGSAAGETA